MHASRERGPDLLEQRLHLEGWQELVRLRRGREVAAEPVLEGQLLRLLWLSHGCPTGYRGSRVPCEGVPDLADSSFSSRRR
jgi:hypothetical protein